MGFAGKVVGAIIGIAVILILVLNYQSIFVFFYKAYNPQKIIIGCERDYLCVGKVEEVREEEVWLNVKGRFLEKRVDLVRRCEGREINLSVNLAGCSDVVFYDARPVDCGYAVSFCKNIEERALVERREARYLGIKCENWPSYCSAISSRNSVDVVIDNLEETGVVVSNTDEG